MCGYIKAHRSFLRWRWYGDPPTTLVFFHCLLKANYYDSHWKDKEVKRGSFITSLSKIAEETGLTVKQVRRAVSNLEKTGEIEKQGTKWTQITICNYDKYQTRGEIEGTKRAQSGHDEGTKRATNKEVKKERSKETTSSEGEAVLSFFEKNLDYIAREKAVMISEELAEHYASDLLMACKTNGTDFYKAIEAMNEVLERNDPFWKKQLVPFRNLIGTWSDGRNRLQALIDDANGFTSKPAKVAGGYDI